MADFVKGLFGGVKSSAASAVSSADADFADFASAPAPSPVSLTSSVIAPTAKPTFGPGVPWSDRPYTKWYNVHERVSLADFYAELFILPFLLVVIAVHVWGTRTNRRKAKAWMTAHAPALESEFAVVGLGDQAGETDLIENGLLKEKSKDLFASYASGRQNVAFVDIKLHLLKRYNPLVWFGEAFLAFFFEGWPTPEEKAVITAYAFDGKEAQIIPRAKGDSEAERKARDSVYDGFVWAVVHKDSMKKLRDERYDLSLTTTKDHAKLPDWATVMSESAEITETLLTADLIKAVQACGEDLEALIVTDMPVDAPKSLNDLVPKKRLSLTLRMSEPSRTAPLLSTFLRMPDHLVSSAHFRAEVLRRVRTTREEESKKLRKLDEEEKAEERKTLSDKAKKDERDRKLKGMTADEQRKYLEKEREKNARKQTQRKTMKA